MGCTAGTGVATALMMLKMNTMALRTNPECNNGLMFRHESEDDWEDASAPPADYLERVQVGAENGITKTRIWEITSKMLKFGKTERN